MHAELTLTSTYHPCNQVAGMLRGHVAAAQSLLGSSKPTGARIHAGRQELKRARATLRLLRESVDPEHYRKEDAILRQAAQQLNRARDSDVLWRVFSRLGEVVKDMPSRKDLEPLRKLLLQERRSATSNALREPLTNVRTLLLQATQRTSDWFVADDLDLLRSAMRRTYWRRTTRCRRRFAPGKRDQA